jgi:hypothetical protein
MYGEDFGQTAADQLLGWANAQVGTPTLSERSPKTMKTPCPPPPVPKKIPQTHTVDPARLQRGQWSQVFNKTVGEGDIAASYCADTIAMHSRVSSPFKFEGELWACTNLAGHGEAYRLVPLEQFAGTPTTYAEKSRDGDIARADPDGFYHGIKVQHRKQWFVLGGPPVRFVPELKVSAVPAPRMEQMQLFAEMG